MRRSQKILAITAAYLAIIWLISALPLASALIEFPAPSVCGSSLGWQQARLYSSFFIYPVFFGLFVQIALFAPLTTVAHLMTKRVRVRVLCISSMTILVTIFCALEFVGSPYAPFEIAPQALADTGRDRLDEFLQPLCDGEATETRVDFQQYQATLSALHSEATSWTKLVYRVGFFAQSVFHANLLITTTIFMVVGSETLRRWHIVLPEFNTSLLGFALLFGSLWVLFRMTYRLEIHRVFENIDAFPGDIAVTLVYGSFLLAFMAIFWFNLEQFASRVTTALGVVAWLFGAVLINFIDPSTVFGSRAPLVNLLLLDLMAVILAMPALLLICRSWLLRPV